MPILVFCRFDTPGAAAADDSGAMDTPSGITLLSHQALCPAGDYSAYSGKSNGRVAVCANYMDYQYIGPVAQCAPKFDTLMKEE